MHRPRAALLVGVQTARTRSGRGGGVAGRCSGSLVAGAADAATLLCPRLGASARSVGQPAARGIGFLVRGVAGVRRIPQVRTPWAVAALGQSQACAPRCIGHIAVFPVVWPIGGPAREGARTAIGMASCATTATTASQRPSTGDHTDDRASSLWAAFPMGLWREVASIVVVAGIGSGSISGTRWRSIYSGCAACLGADAIGHAGASRPSVLSRFLLGSPALRGSGLPGFPSPAPQCPKRHQGSHHAKQLRRKRLC